ncbi:hypothetical protein F4814DRAFT_446549 [Daldinia grandis]|nr:hypothetical protein F4814DRAFT_446549 [Daldinia grandis]
MTACLLGVGINKIGIMSSFEGPSLDSAGDVWVQNKQTIERLYAVEDKTAEEVMEILEREFGCPRINKKAFQKIIRNKLKLSKRLKKGDWSRIYRNSLIHRKDKPTVVYHNNRKIIWKDVIKETKRSGPLPDTGQDGDATLPTGIILRTPSPPASRLFQSSAMNTQQSIGSSSQPSAFPLTAPTVPLATGLPTSTIGSIENALNGIPWVKLNHRMLSATASYDSDTTFPLDINSLRALIDTRLGIDSFKIWKAALPSTKLPFLSSVPSAFTLAPDIDAYHLLAKVVHLLSNNSHCCHLGQYHNEFTGAIQLLSSQIPQAVPYGLFQHDLPDLKIIWENLTECAGIFCYQGTFTSLMKAGFQHKEWILPKGALYLSFAATLNSLDVVQDLLNVSIRADDVANGRNHPALIDAAAAGNIECVNLLLRACNVNRKITQSASSFQILLTTFLLQGNQNRGANVDLPWTPRFTIDNRIYDIPKKWRPTTLEKTYYWDKNLFSELVPYSTGATGRIFQLDICILVREGKEFLRQYLSSQPKSDPEKKASLELVLLQQIIYGKILDSEDMRIIIHVIQGLLEFDVDPKFPSLKRRKVDCISIQPLDIQSLFQHLILKPDVHISASFDTVLKLILKSGATISSDVLAAGVRKEGIDVLEALERVGADVRQYGAIALVVAARVGNYDAVTWLLDSGVDFNAVVPGRYQSVIVLASYSRTFCQTFRNRWYKQWDEISGPASCEMLRYLIGRGADLKKHPNDRNAFRFLHTLLLGYDANGSLFDKVEPFLSKLHPHDWLNLMAPAKVYPELVSIHQDGIAPMKSKLKPE